MSVADEDAERGIRDSFHCTYGLQRSRKIAKRTGLLECVFAELQYSGGCFDPRGRIRIRINRFPTRVTLKGEVFDSWDDEPCEIKRRISAERGLATSGCMVGRGEFLETAEHLSAGGSRIRRLVLDD
ncbi:MAG TPA: hypothetical protein VFE62_26860 [Gemmataceae bacterium]|nr:hypothetical protein [Gemmataceae bacterium]